MTCKKLTFEEVNAHVEKVVHKPKSVVTTIADLCTVYQDVAPILNLVVAIPFLPSTWQTVLQDFVATLDSLCPPTP